jgi:hypothetical protein
MPKLLLVLYNAPGDTKGLSMGALTCKYFLDYRIKDPIAAVGRNPRKGFKVEHTENIGNNPVAALGLLGA